MRLLLAFTLLGCIATAAEPDLVRMIAQIDDLAAREVPVARVDTWLKLAAALEKSDAELSGKYVTRATELLQGQPDIPATRTAVVNLFTLDPSHAEQILLARSDPAPARGRVIEYLLAHGQPVEAAALLDARELKAEELKGADLPNLLTPVTAALAKLSETHPEQARIGLRRILALFDDPQLGLEGARVIAEWPGGVKTLNSRDTILILAGVLAHQIDPAGYREHASLFAPWTGLLDAGSVPFGRPLSRRVEYAKGHAPKVAPDVEKVPVADALAAVRGDWVLAEQVTIHLVELKRERDDILAAAEVYLEALEQGAHNPDAYEYIARLVRNYSLPLGGRNPSIQARLALADLTPLLSAKYDFTLPDLNGEPISLSTQNGKVVLVNFWATWCVPCREEMPMLERIYRQYRDRGLVVLAVTDDPPEVAQRFIAERGLTFPVLIDSQHSVHDHYGVLGIPVTKVLDRTGVIRATLTETRESDLMHALSSAQLSVDR
jgi:peroxiredoxin